MTKVFKLICIIAIAALSLSLGAVLLPAGQAESASAGDFTGDTYYVDIATGVDNYPDQDGSAIEPWKTISYALDQVSGGDEIIVLPGYYLGSAGETFPIEIDKDVYLHSRDGTDADDLTVINCDSYECASAVLVYSNVTAILEGFIVSTAVPVYADGIYVRSQTDGGSVTIQDCGIYTYHYNGIFIESISNNCDVSILDCSIGNNNWGIQINNGEGNAMSSGATLTIEGCEIGGGDVGNDDDGIRFASDVVGSTVEITGCAIDYNNPGIYFWSVEDSSTVTITDNSVSNNTNYGINVENLEGSSDFDITGNTIEGNYDNGVNFGNIVSGSTVTIEDNSISDNSGDGIFAVDVEDATVTVENNIITGNGASEPDTGMYFEYIYGDSVVDITGNTISGNYGGGIYLYRVYEYAVLNISDNLIEESVDIYLSNDADGIHLVTASDDAVITIEDNEITGNEGDGIDIEQMGGVESPSVVIFCNTISGNADDGVDVNYQEHDYMITVSPCNDIFDNEGYGINNEGAKDYYYWIDATGNWWGDASGPGGVGPGTGDEVTDYVDYGESAGLGDGQWLPAPCGEGCEEPRAGISASVSIGDAPLTVQFKDSSSGDTDTWHWSFGDGGSSSSRHPAYTFQNAGTYYVTLTVSNECGQSDTATVTILVDEGTAGAPSLTVTSLNADPAYIYPGQATRVTATVTNYGSSWGSGSLNLLVNGYLEQQDGFGLAAGSSETVAFTVYRTEPGEYQVTFGDAAATFYVMETTDSSSQTSGPFAGGPLDTGGIIAIICIGVILLGGIVLVFLFARRT